MAAKKKAAKKKVGGARRGALAKPTKDETVEVDSGAAAPLLAGNMPPIKDILYHMDQIAGYEAKAKTAGMAVKKAKDAAKAAGIDMKAIAEAKGLNGMDPLDMATYFRQLQAVMREKGMPIQIGLFEPFVVVVLPAVVVTGVPVDTAVHEFATMNQRSAVNMTVTWGAAVPAFCAVAQVTGTWAAAFCAE